VWVLEMWGAGLRGDGGEAWILEGNGGEVDWGAGQGRVKLNGQVLLSN
jgi:hypothetical protein